MSINCNKLAKLYSHKLLSFTDLDKKENLAVIDFKKPWWAIFLKSKARLVLILSGRIIASILITLLPALIGYAFKSQKFSSFSFLLVGLICSESWRFYTVYVCVKFIASIVSGVRYSAFRFFLTVDPIYHTKRATGEVFGKIERCVFAYAELIDSAIYDILPIIVGISTVVITFFIMNPMLGIIAFIFIFIICFFNIAMVLFNSLAFEKKVIKADDAVKNVGVESLLQIGLIRSAFATNEMNNQIESKSSYSMAMDSAYFISFTTAMFVTRILYAISLCILGVYVISLVKAGTISALIGSAFLATYLHGTYHIIRIGKRIQKFVRSVTRINDLFIFIRRFGKKTFPVLKKDVSDRYEIPTSDMISIKAKNIYFSYEKVDIFKGNNLILNVPHAQKNKLYGIIGPSGVGKTTLISILGGQLKPKKGTVDISGIPIYKINDYLRRKLISMQGQSAASLSGTVRDNLLIGIPKKRSMFKDEYMLEVLRKVGVWNVFKEKEGLDSMIGEGGLNLSVGQRQRLNFAALYLRTKYFKPLLVMIDEPTSSLDEVSEQAITDMIYELAKDAVVFVIAHRIHTLDAAVGILDCSLIPVEKNLIFYSRDQLIEKSIYYQKLIRGEVAIEE
jgi:ATP-binding cassette subfamily B protein